MMPSSASSPQAITPSLSLPVGPQVIELIKRAYASGTPLLLEGPHGVGKSELVTQAASELGIDVIVRDLTVKSSTAAACRRSTRRCRSSPPGKSTITSCRLAGFR
jgi:MoxR-like ATPase